MACYRGRLEAPQGGFLYGPHTARGRPTDGCRDVSAREHWGRYRDIAVRPLGGTWAVRRRFQGMAARVVDIQNMHNSKQF